MNKPKETIIMYEKPTCSKCRMANTFLSKEGVLYKTVNYYTNPLSKAKLRELLKKMGIRAQELLRNNEPIYVKLGLAKKKATMTEDELIGLMIKYPDLMQRPIIERGERAVLGRPTEKIIEILK